MTKNRLNSRAPLAHRFLCLLLAGLTACGTTRSQIVTPRAGGPTAALSQVVENWGMKEQSLHAADPEIAPGFLLTLHCLSDSRLNGDYRVGFDGNLPLPYDVAVNTTGQTLAQIQKKITDLYRPYFKTSSDIDLKVKERRYWVDVRGLVQKPGRYLIEPEASLDLMIGLAGGTSKEPPPQSVRIQKDRKVFVLDLNQYYRRGEEHPQILGWLGGEEIFFQKEIAAGVPVYILGEVKKPGDYMLNPGSDFVDTLVQVGGFTERADLDNIELIRKTAKGKRAYDFSWRNLSRAPAPQQGDVIVVHADATTRSERRVTLFATLISAAASIATSVILVLSYNRGRI